MNTKLVSAPTRRICSSVLCIFPCSLRKERMQQSAQQASSLESTLCAPVRRVRHNTRGSGDAALCRGRQFRKPDDLLLDRVLHQLSFVMDVQFAHEIEFMRFDGLDAQIVTGSY